MNSPTENEEKDGPLRIGFIHPDLGIGELPLLWSLSVFCVFVVGDCEAKYMETKSGCEMRTETGGRSSQTKAYCERATADYYSRL